MQNYQTLIDLDELFDRRNETHNPSKYPLGLEESMGIIVEEDRTSLPRYQARPGPLVFLMKNTMEITSRQFKEIEDNLGMNAPEEEMYTIRRTIYGLNRSDSWGRNLYYSSLIISKNLESDNPLASKTDETGWHYLFKPGILNLGRTGRVLENKKGERFEEEILLNITPELVYDAVTNGGLYYNRLGLVKPNGEVVVVHDVNHSEYGDEPYYGKIPDKFPKQKTKKRVILSEDFKQIDLTEIVNNQGMAVVEHPFLNSIQEYSNMFYFSTSSGSVNLNEIAANAAAKTNNLVWKLAMLGLLDNDPNNFICNSTWRLFNMPGIYENRFSLGSTGRDIKIADNKYKDGNEWPSNWQPEYISMEIDRNMIISALFELKNEFRQLIGYKKEIIEDAPWEVLYKQGKIIDPENKEIFQYQKKEPKNILSHSDSELIEMIEPRGLIPTKKNSLH